MVDDETPRESSAEAQEGADAAAPAAPADAPAAAQEGAPSGDADAGPAAQSGDEEAAPSAPRRGAPTEDDDADEAPRQKPAVPGADLEVDIVLEGVDPLSRGALGDVDPYADESDGEATDEAGAEEAVETQPITQVAIDLGADARYGATGKRKTAIARVILRPGTGEYRVNGRALNEHFPRPTLQRNIRQPLETVGYEARMDVVALLEGGGISAQADALRHGISRALLEADPNLRGELKRRGFLTRDARAKERKKAGLKKARKRPQFSKR